MKFEKTYSTVIAVLLIISITASLIGLIISATYFNKSICFIKFGILTLYLTPLASILTLLAKAFFDKNYRIIILVIIIMMILLVNLYYLGLPQIPFLSCD